MADQMKYNTLSMFVFFSYKSQNISSSQTLWSIINSHGEQGYIVLLH